METITPHMLKLEDHQRLPDWPSPSRVGGNVATLFWGGRRGVRSRQVNRASG